MFSSSLRRIPPWSSVVPGLSASTVLGCKESLHIPHASMHLPSDDVCFIFLTSQDVETEELEAEVVRRIKLCESLAKSRGVVYLTIGDISHTYFALSDTIRQNFSESTTLPFLLPLSKAEDLVPVLESFIRDLRAQKIAFAERTRRLRNACVLRSLNLLGEAVTHTKINEDAVYCLVEAFPSMATYSEACVDPNARQRLATALIMPNGQKGYNRQIADSLKNFWQQDQTL